MPTYDYVCSTNGETVEVYHSFGETLTTWGELCERAEKPVGETDPNTPVERALSGGLPIVLTNGKTPESGCCQSSSSCGCG